MTIKAWPPQDPNAKLDYWLSAAEAVAEQSSPLATWEIEISGADSALQKSGEVESGGVVYFWLEGPTEDVTYTVTLHFELANGFRDDNSRTLTGAHT
jgi:hypothetical protein